MRHMTTMVVSFGLVVLCIYTAVLRGQIWLVDAEIEQRTREEVWLDEAIRNTVARTTSKASVVQIAGGAEEDEVADPADGSGIAAGSAGAEPGGLALGGPRP